MDFESFARSRGVVIDHLRPVTSIQRCATDAHPRARNGAWFWDGRQGWVCAWDGGGEVHWYQGVTVNGPTGVERRLWTSRRNARRNEVTRKHEAAAMRAAAMIDACSAGRHGYLRYKGLEWVQALVTPDNALLVPMRNLQTNELQGAQIIRWDSDVRVWAKRMMPGMKAVGAVHRLGRRRALETFLVEGYATGLSVKAAVEMCRLDASVLVCFSDSNLARIGASLTGKVYVFADNDTSGAGERAALKSGKAYCMANSPGDANDLHQTAGIYAVVAKVMEARTRN